MSQGKMLHQSSRSMNENGGNIHLMNAGNQTIMGIL
jgi:hypothetical protein